jgi:cell division protein FtsQ
MAERNPLWTALRLIIALAMLVVLSYAADWVLRTENFPVEQVRFEGPFKHVSQAELEAAMLDLVRGNFFLVDLDAVQQRVEALPWVYRASVRRRFPRDISVAFTEEQLVAHWTDRAWLNTNGDVVRVTGADLPSDMPKLAGPDDTSAHVLAAYQEFGRALAPLNMKLAALTLTPRRSWRLELQAPDAKLLTVVLDHEQPLQRLERFARVYSATLGGEAATIRQVDLRYTNGFAVQWQHGGGQVAHTVAVRNEG